MAKLDSPFKGFVFRLKC